ncbi:hypothetical protein TVNIR_2036 [Thioalkalivibrio nitratireducens DSM 14787]|uniref:Uncharacterized protein n=1 Tax=Thioalkalivibrio nitratireducens (strain DSM 14787 / UNIQEM 213 / ALEN2) TaxID=1255043 RepID=L0DZ84_THIND|nr:hypothetical protein [Thioalkalivibrio nitratireducens]AGA33696.1 hypothetical protein TVNIR_2036 [Thioalkalivibrio nitratireducens DSM 14787]
MKTRKLLERLGHFLDKDWAEQRAELESIQEVLQKLEEKETRLRAKLEAHPDPDERQEIQAKLEVVHAQRQKGLDRVRQLRAHQRGKAPDPKVTERRATGKAD